MIARRTRSDTARDGETLAAEYLAGCGLRILERNFRFHHGEIDIVARDGACIVFVEVKSRSSLRNGSPLHAVTRTKQRQIVRIARGWLHRHRAAGIRCRFDVVAVEFRDDRTIVTHIPNAFTADR